MNMPSSYTTFVRERFKTCPDIGLTLHHATTGMIGEAIEITFAKDRPQFIKECGDFEFYLEALWQNLPKPWPEMDPLHFLDGSIPGIFESLIAVSADLLDLTKKMWIYEQEVDLVLFYSYSLQCRALLDRLYSITGTNPEFVISVNIEKLLKRYPKGYSNEAAQARADGEEQRHDAVV